MSNKYDQLRELLHILAAFVSLIILVPLALVGVESAQVKLTDIRLHAHDKYWEIEDRKHGETRPTPKG